MASKIEGFAGGDLYVGQLDPGKAAEYGKIALDLQTRLVEKCFYTPMLRVPTRLIQRAWLKLEQSRLAADTPFVPLSDFENDTSVGHQIKTLNLLADEIDEQTGVKTEEACLQIYQPGAVMATHSDQGDRVRIINLTGTARVNWHAGSDGLPVGGVGLEPGDMLHLDGVTSHSLRNTGDQPRISLCLIDAQK